MSLFIHNEIEEIMRQKLSGFALSMSFLVSLMVGLFTSTAFAQDKKPNIVIIWGDDIGQSNISAYSHGVMGYQTPNIDRIAKEGMMFTD